MAESLHVSIVTEDEYGAFFDNATDESVKVTARPTYVQYMSTIESRLNGTPCQYSHCSPVQPSRDNIHIIAVSPREGYIGFKLDDPISVYINGNSGSIPTTTGRKTASADIDVSTIDKDMQDDLNLKYTWEGKEESSGTLNDRLHPDAYNTLDETALVDMLTQKKRDDTIPALRRKFRISPMHFEPVIVKLASRKPRPDTVML